MAGVVLDATPVPYPTLHQGDAMGLMVSTGEELTGAPVHHLAVKRDGSRSPRGRHTSAARTIS